MKPELIRGICNICEIEITETKVWINDGYPFQLYIPLYCESCIEPVDEDD